MSIRSRRGASALVVALAMLAALPLTSALATKDFAFSGRFDGANRFDTARKIASGSGFSNVANVVVATGRNFPDALAGSYLSASLGSPILLTEPTSLPIETNTALVNLQAKTVTLLGGTAAISQTVENDLKGRGYEVRRVAGTSRYDTALAAAKDAALATPVGTVAGKRTAFLATGENFADALAAGPASYAGKLPILLTAPGSLSPQARQGIQDLKIEQVIVLGGTNAVSPGVETEVKTIPGVTTARIQGADRSQTATGIADFSLANLAFDATKVDLARGNDFADALAGGPHGGRDKTPMLLAASPSALDTSVGANATWLRAHASTLLSGHIFGGTAAISAAVADAAAAAAGAAPPEAPDGTYKTVKVQSVAYADDYFVSSTGQRFSYDSGDTFQFQGSATSMTASTFEAMLNPDDIVDITYVSAGTSTFNVTNDVVHQPAAPTIQYQSSAGDKAIVTAFVPTDNSPGTKYVVELVPVNPACGGQPTDSGDPRLVTVATFLQSEVSGTSKSVTTQAFTNGPPAPYSTGCYTARTTASSAAPSTAVVKSAYGNQLQLPSSPLQPPDFTKPLINKATLTDAAPANAAGKGDVHVFEFSEVMAASTAANGSSYRLVDSDGTAIDVVCGQGGTTCVLDSNNFDPNTRTQYSKLTVTLGGTPTASGGSAAGFQYTSGGTPSLIGSISGWSDNAGNPVDLSASPDKSLP